MIAISFLTLHYLTQGGGAHAHHRPDFDRWDDARGPVQLQVVPGPVPGVGRHTAERGGGETPRRLSTARPRGAGEDHGGRE